MNDDIDMTATCKHCSADIEHYAGIPGSEYMTPFWRHLWASVASRPHPAVPDPTTIKQVSR